MIHRGEFLSCIGKTRRLRLILNAKVGTSKMDKIIVRLSSKLPWKTVKAELKMKCVAPIFN